MNKDNRVYVAGHSGLAGSAILRNLQNKGYDNLILKTHQEVDLISAPMVDWLFSSYQPEYVFLAAARVGGVLESITHPTELLSDNLLIQTNVINACHTYKVKKLLFLGSSCIYPIDGPQPYKEEQLGDGKTDENWSYAIAKLAGIELCRSYHRQYGSDFITAIPCNLYGPGDNFDLEKSHVIPALIRKCHENPYLEIWGEGFPRREFLYVDDFADACVMLMEKYSYEDIDGVVNLGTGEDIPVRQLARMIRDIVSRCKEIYFDFDKPSGVTSKLMDISRIEKLGWTAKISLDEGIRNTFEWYKENLCGE